MQMVGIELDEISLVSVLPACAQLGALELGKWIHIYADKAGFLRDICVCNALIEVYAKRGRLANHGRAREAIELFQEMQKAKVEPNIITFVGLLSACAHAGLLNEGLGSQGNLKIAAIAMEHLLELEPDNTGNYVLLSNLYADLGKWDGVSRMRKLMSSKYMNKTPGCSSIEVDNMVQEFASGDDSKPFS
ncbi:Pentatricopeptide repeat-containing protein [Vitis vinifera]|uniref:Pentatricopeptide repeat-containing protein n=1 Tax=Vitis vinifera TaxID=29760 RepID=A0A438F1Q3_VITVI|nr:Pentatricopeptide repeat-containing protein [Vitis vinifera]